MLQKIGSIWAGLETRKQILVASALVMLLVGVFVLARLATAPSMKLLYTGLDPSAAGEVIQALEQNGTMYRVQGSSILVLANERDQLRLTLAGQGLPSNGGKGYELLDSLSGFGTTSQMFDAAYWRAKEGELARTILASPHISNARVHIAYRAGGAFRRNSDTSASVSVASVGAQITPEQAKAIRYLVASAVPGILPENVAIIDADGILIGEGGDVQGQNTSDDHADKLREKVLRLIEARVGRGNAVVEVSVDTVTETETIRETKIDPNARVAISTDVEEREDSATNQSANVTIASNLPDGDGEAGTGNNSSAISTRERVNYEVSQTEFEILRVPGDVRRLSVAVLVNDAESEDEQGNRVLVPRTDEELQAMEDLVQSAVGYDEARGDVVTIKSMPLPKPETIGTEAPDRFSILETLDVMSLIQIATLAIVLLALGLFVVRPIFSNAPVSRLAAIAENGGRIEQEEIVALDGEIEQVGATGTTSAAQVPVLAPAREEGRGAVSDEAVERLRNLIGHKQDETVEILRSWLEEGRERA